MYLSCECQLIDKTLKIIFKSWLNSSPRFPKQVPRRIVLVKTLGFRRNMAATIEIVYLAKTEKERWRFNKRSFLSNIFHFEIVWSNDSQLYFLRLSWKIFSNIRKVEKIRSQLLYQDETVHFKYLVFYQLFFNKFILGQLLAIVTKYFHDLIYCMFGFFRAKLVATGFKLSACANRMADIWLKFGHMKNRYLKNNKTVFIVCIIDH